MKRAGGLWPRVVAFEHLRESGRKAARGKRDGARVCRYLLDLEGETLRLQDELVDGSWRPGPVTRFEVHDPKRRTITVAPFRDRVVHHAVIGVLEPILDRRMAPASFACRKGMGTHAALDHAQRLLRRWPWFAKLDVEQCFASIRHDLVLAALARKVKDRRVLELFGRILGGPAEDERPEPGRGLPIGNLTSQWSCNLLLDRLDHFVLGELRSPGYVRYMDDFVLFAGSKGEARSLRDAAEGFLIHELDLRPNPRAALLAPRSVGLPFLGWRLYPGTRRVRPGNLRRIRQRLRRRSWEVRTGRAPLATFHASLASTVAHLEHGSTRRLRRTWLADYPEPVRGRSP